MKTLTNDRLNKIASWRKTYGDAHNVMMPAHEAEELVSRLLTAEKHLTEIGVNQNRGWREAHCAKLRAESAEAQLAELGRQSGIVAWQHKGQPWQIILDRDIEEVRKNSGCWLPLGVVTVPQAVSQPSREQLRSLVDVVWNTATESTAVPSTKWADELIDKVFAVLPASQPTPVATLDIQSGRPDGRKFALVYSSAAHELPDDVYHLYTGPASQPYTVLDEAKSRELFEAWFSVDCSFDCSPEATDADNYAWKESLWHTWEHCRAAMLQSQPVSCGYTLPEGYALVPIEPTEAMMLVLGMTGSFDSMIAKYQKMLAAAPQHKESK